MSLKLRLILLNFLEFAIWGAYLTSMGAYLAKSGMGAHISYFYAVQGFVSLVMPALMGIVADRWVPAQRVLSFCHLLAGCALIAAGSYGYMAGNEVSFGILFTLYTLNVMFFMPTIPLSYSVAYIALDKAGLDAMKNYPPIRVWGTVGFIITMIMADLLGLQQTPGQFILSGVLALLLSAYDLTLPSCPVTENTSKKTWVEAMGLQAFLLFRRFDMAIFFLFSFLLGAALQITNGYANPFISSFANYPEYADTFGVQHANVLISLSQMSEALCILLIPFFLKRYGIKVVMLMAMLAWVFRFGLFGLGNPGSGVWMFVLSMLVYGVAFDFFNVAGSLFVNHKTDVSIRSSAQGLFIMMTNGFGSSIGTLVAGSIVNAFVYHVPVEQQMAGWSTVWMIFAVYALVVAVLFFFLFKHPHHSPK